MGREVRMVPPNWDHPKQEGWTDGRLQPMFDQTYESAAADWKAEFAKWEAGERPSYCSDESKNLEYWEYNGAPPDRPYYRPWRDEDATWVQVWETVSEGTPVTPPFATKAELVDYLVANGDFWDQKRWAENRWNYREEHGKPGWDRAAAEKFVGDGWAPSLMVNVTSEGTKIIEPRDGGMLS